MKNLPNDTRASSNERIFRWAYGKRLNLKYVTKMLSTEAETDGTSTRGSTLKNEVANERPEVDYICCWSNLSPNSYQSGCCIKADGWIKYAFEHYSRPFDIVKESKIFNELVSIWESSFEIESDIQRIKNDISRTVINESYFQAPNKGYNKVYEVLKAFTLYDSKCGYVQGMNFIVAALAYHCNSPTTFWLFTSLIEDYGLRSNYIQGFEGLYERSITIAETLQTHNNQLYTFLVSSMNKNWSLFIGTNGCKHVKSSKLIPELS